MMTETTSEETNFVLKEMVMQMEEVLQEGSGETTEGYTPREDREECRHLVEVGLEQGGVEEVIGEKWVVHLIGLIRRVESDTMIGACHHLPKE